MGPSPRDYTTVLLLTIFLGFWGIHRFVVGKVGTGVLYVFTYGLFLIGWIVDIISVATGTFTDKEGRRITRVRPGESTTKQNRAARAFTPDPDEGVEFVAEGKDPERDSHGRVIARLGAGSQFDIPVHWVDDADIDAITAYVQGSKELVEDDEGTITRRFRLIPVLTDYWGGRCYRLETPGGYPAFEIRDYFVDRFGLANQIITDATPILRNLDAALAQASFVFDVAVKLDYVVEDVWDDDIDEDSEENTIDLVLDSPSVRIRNPLRIQIRSARA
jgi:hypothetical protein